MDAVHMILAALEMGGHAGEPAIAQAYAGLKARVETAFGDNARARRALGDFVEDPETYQRPLAKALLDTGAEKNADLLDAAERLLHIDAPAGFDVLRQIAEREHIRRSDRFTRHAQSVSGVKAQEEAASRRRMEQYWREELERRAQLSEQQTQVKLRERQLLMAVLIVSAALFIGFVLLVLLTSRG